MFSSSFTFQALAQCFSTISQGAGTDHNPHTTTLEPYRSPVGAVNGQQIPTTYATETFRR
jgi:hypothetical protein